MSPTSSKFDSLCSLKDLAMAYRKTKVDLFYSSRMRQSDLLEFETNLVANLKRLRETLLKGEAPNIPDTPWTYEPKAISIPKSIQEAVDSNYVSSDPQHQWQMITQIAKGNTNKEKVIAVFRLMEALPIEFHVFATLWIYKVGHKFEKYLSEAAKGNRLRRDRNNEELTQLSLGSTGPYRQHYRKWRDDGINTARNGLAEEKSIVVLAADISSYYHKIDVGFMLEPDFTKLFDIDLNSEEEALHTCFIKALQDWSAVTPLGMGLPVGLTASSVIANVAAFEFDQIIEKKISPLYYGRYVDDVLIVMENAMGFKNTEEVWKWISDRSDGALSISHPEDDSSKDYVVSYYRSYLGRSEIHFKNEKNKAFDLSGPSGRSLLSSIQYQISRRTSEWRSFPDVPSDNTKIESELITAIQTDGEPADNFNRVNKVSVRRASVAFKLRDIEAYNNALPPEAWEHRRHSFLDSFTRHVLVLPTFFDFYMYVGRVISLATSCADFVQLRKIADALQSIMDELRKYKIQVEIKGGRSHTGQKAGDILNQAEEELRSYILQSLYVSFPSNLSVSQRRAWNNPSLKQCGLLNWQEVDSIQSTSRSLFCHDLAQLPLKQTLLPQELIGSTQIPAKRNKLTYLELEYSRGLVAYPIVKAVSTLSHIAGIPKSLGQSIGLLFPTRPPKIHELYILHPHPFTNEGANDILVCLSGLRGVHFGDDLPMMKRPDKHSPIVFRTGIPPRNKIKIAVASWKTDIESWAAAVSKHSEPDSTRYDRLNRLLNSVLSSRTVPDYLVLPELSLPACWYSRYVDKLKEKRISLISGIEYIHVRGTDRVRNQVWISIINEASGYRYAVPYIQDKQRPALLEERELHRIGGKILKPESRFSQPPIIDHDGFHFAILICSELTNISYRATLRGKVDALFVPAWNKDINSFAAIVESAALDMHAYIIQCNDREYGDSRIRAPYKDSWKRENVRVKGGLDDYFVVGEIDIADLRQFQSNHRSPERPFKPVPDGFSISPQRKARPRA